MDLRTNCNRGEEREVERARVRIFLYVNKYCKKRRRVRKKKLYVLYALLYI